MEQKITEQQAIRESKDFWRHALDGTKRKRDILKMPEFQHFREYNGCCPLCEYTDADGHCENCPLLTQLGHDCLFPEDIHYKYHPQAFAQEIMKLKEVVM